MNVLALSWLDERKVRVSEGTDLKDIVLRLTGSAVEASVAQGLNDEVREPLLVMGTSPCGLVEARSPGLLIRPFGLIVGSEGVALMV